jgi:ATP-binding cassette subfamily B protein
VSAVLELAWPSERLLEGLELCARRAGLEPLSVAVLPSAAEVERALDAGAAALGIELEPVDVPLTEVAAFLRRAAPVVVRLPGAAPVGTRYLFLVRGGRRVRVLAPNGDERRVPVSELAAFFAHDLRTGALRHVDELLQRTNIHARRARRAREALLGESLGRFRLSACWLLRQPPGRSALAAARLAGVPARFALVVAAHALVYALWLLAWIAVGRGALAGHVEAGWLAAFGLLLLTAIPFRALERWTSGALSIDLGALLKRRLFAGALRLEPDEVRHLGAGQLLGRVLESEAVEALALAGGFLVVGAAIELVFGAWVLAQAPGGGLLVLLLCAWSVVALVLAWRTYRAMQVFTHARVDMTDDLVERMVGHRTRLAQEAPERWHAGEDERLERYLESSRHLDRHAIALHGAVPAAWLALGLAGLVPAFVGAEATPAGLAIGVGGVLLAQGAFSKLVRGAFQLAGLGVAWQTVGPLFRAAARTPALPAPELCGVDAASGEDSAALAGAELCFRHAGRERAVLDSANFVLARGARVLVEGPSGSGKSTLVALLTGLRAPQSGLLRLAGLDRSAWGAEGWLRRVSAAPQLHENHVFSGTLAFNLLFGRDWPASDRDLAEAEALCHELGLGPLLARMPSGLQQTVGETGWQLSHGEKSRLYLARALLHGGEVTVLDESFATLDPETLRLAMATVQRRAQTLVCVAHP